MYTRCLASSTWRLNGYQFAPSGSYANVLQSLSELPVETSGHE